MPIDMKNLKWSERIYYETAFNSQINSLKKIYGLSPSYVIEDEMVIPKKPKGKTYEEIVRELQGNK